MTLIRVIERALGADRLVREVTTGEVLFVMVGAGGGGAPAPTPEERELTRVQTQATLAQLEIAKQQQAEMEALRPIFLADYDLQRIEDPETGAIRYETAPGSLGEQSKEIQRLQQERSLKALRGELPVTETLQSELEHGQRALAERLNRQLGPGWETSTPGIQALAEYERMATALKEGERQDQLTTAEALALNRQTGRQQNVAGIYDTVSAPGVSASNLYSGAVGSAVDALRYPLARREERFGYKERHRQEIGDYVSGGVTLGAMGLMAGLPLLSHPSFKEDIRPVEDERLLEMVRDVPVYRWRYTGDDTEHIGGMTTDMPAEVTTPNKMGYRLLDYMAMLHGAVRSLDKKVTGGRRPGALALLPNSGDPLSPGEALGYNA